MNQLHHTHMQTVSERILPLLVDKKVFFGIAVVGKELYQIGHTVLADADTAVAECFHIGHTVHIVQHKGLAHTGFADDHTVPVESDTSVNELMLRNRARCR